MTTTTHLCLESFVEPADSERSLEQREIPHPERAHDGTPFPSLFLFLFLLRVGARRIAGVGVGGDVIRHPPRELADQVHAVVPARQGGVAAGRVRDDRRNRERKPGIRKPGIRSGLIPARRRAQRVPGEDGARRRGARGV